MTDTRQYDVFISFFGPYLPWAETLARNLKAQGLAVFFDNWEIAAGDAWVTGLHRGLAASRAGLLVATADAADPAGSRASTNACWPERLTIAISA